MQRLNIDLLNDSFDNKDFSFTSKQRQELKLDGLLPPIGSDECPPKESSPLEYQYQVALKRFNRFKDPLDKYDWIMTLGDRNKRLFYLLLSKNPSEIMPFVYTPTVGAACQELSLVYRSGRGLYITRNHAGQIKQVLSNWPSSNIKAICVTDGERILGLGDLGAFGMGIPVGKLALYTALAGIHPQSLLPITLDVGTNNENLLSNPEYFGLREKRLTGAKYDEFIEEFMQACVAQFGEEVLIQFEDFANHNAFRLLSTYAPKYCSFNDDIQGTASVVLAALLGTQRLTGRKLKDERIVCFGAGEAALGLAELAVRALELRDGISHEKAKENIFMVDSRGLIVHDRSTGGLTDAKLQFARPKGAKEVKDLLEIIRDVKPTCLIGASAVPNSFNETLLKAMSELNEKPVIMALSNPTSKAECTAEQAYLHTNGKAIFASGSPFGEIKLADGSIKRPAQANNAYVFPGVALGILVGRIFPVNNDDFLVAAETVSRMANESELEKGSVLPSFERIRDVSRQIAKNVIEAASKEKRTKATFADSNALEKAINEASQYPFDCPN